MSSFAKGFIGTLAVGLAVMAPVALHGIAVDGPAAGDEPTADVARRIREPRPRLAPERRTRGRLRFAAERVRNSDPEPDSEGAQAATAAEVPETGGETLVVRLFDADSGRPVAMAAQLWRLGLPETAEFHAGDLLIEKSLEIQTDGKTLVDLPEGRYRLDCHGQRKGAEDPHEFRLTGGRTEVASLVRPPRTMDAWVRVYGEESEELRRCHRRYASSSSRSSSPRTPAWASPRRPKSGGASRCFGMGIGCGRGRSPGREIHAAADGFSLERITEDSRTESHSRNYDLVFAGRSSVRCAVKGSDTPEPRYVALAVPIELLIEDVFLSDGTPVADVEHELKATCHAVLSGDRDPAEAARTLPVRVDISVKGYEKLSFTWSATDAPARRELRRPE